MNRCCFPKCDAEIEKGRVCCLAHWQSLPSRIKAGAQERLRGWKSPIDAREFIQGYIRAQKRKEANDGGGLGQSA